jgi:hypothetical protein
VVSWIRRLPERSVGSRQDCQQEIFFFLSGGPKTVPQLSAVVPRFASWVICPGEKAIEATSFDAPFGPWSLSYQMRCALQDAMRDARRWAANGESRGIEHLSFRLCPIPPPAFNELSFMADNAHLRASGFLGSDYLANFELLHVLNHTLCLYHRKRKAKEGGCAGISREMREAHARLEQMSSLFR